MPKAPAAGARITRRSLVTLPFAYAAVGRAAASRPNVIVILVDDMGFSTSPATAAKSPRPTSTNSPPAACASPSSTTPPAAAPLALPCSPASIRITQAWATSIPTSARDRKATPAG